MIKRKALAEQLLGARHRRCILLQGPAGSGKSTVMATWAQTLGPKGFDMAWLTLASQDHDLAHLFDGLVAALTQSNVALEGMGTLPGMAQDPEDLDRLAITLVRAITDHRRELLLIIDDLHHLSSTQPMELLQRILDFAPPNLHLVLASRNAVPLSLARLRAQGSALELDQQALRFSVAESTELLQDLTPGLMSHEARTLHELADGWVLGLQLLAAEWNARSAHAGKRPSIEEFTHLHVRNADAFSVFFEREVLSRLTPAELDLLVNASICERFTASLSASLAGRPGAIGEAMSMLMSLRRDSLFISGHEEAGREDTYTLHPLLRQALQYRMSIRSQEEQRRVHALAWEWFREHDQFEEAVRHAVLAGETDAAADLVERVAYRLRTQGDIRAVGRMIRQLPPRHVDTRLSLRLLKIRLQILTRDLEGADASLHDLDISHPGDRNPERFATLLTKASLAVQRDQIDDFLPLLPELLEGPEQPDAMLIGGRNNLLTWFYLQQGDYVRARGIQSDATPLLVDGMPLIGSGSGSLQGRCLTGLSYALEGQMTQAERIYRDVMHEAEQFGGTYRRQGYLAAALLAEVLYEIDDRSGAQGLLISRVDVLERISIPDSVLRVMIVLSRTHWLDGRRLEAFSYLERLEEYATRYRLNRLLAHSLAEQLRRHLEMAALEPAGDCLERLESLRPTASGPVPGGAGSVAVLCAFAQLAWAMACGDFERAATQIEALSPICERRNEQRTKVILLMRNALLHWRMQQPAVAETHLREALLLGHRLGLLRRLLDVDLAVPRMLRELMPGDIGDPVLTFYLKRLRGAERSASGRGMAATTGNEAQSVQPAEGLDLLSEREIAVVSCLAQALSNKKIARNLGVTPETVKWHFKNIFSKLNVSSRDEALARLRDLGWNEADSTTY